MKKLLTSLITFMLFSNVGWAIDYDNRDWDDYNNEGFSFSLALSAVTIENHTSDGYILIQNDDTGWGNHVMLKVMCSTWDPVTKIPVGDYPINNSGAEGTMWSQVTESINGHTAGYSMVYEVHQEHLSDVSTGSYPQSGTLSVSNACGTPYIVLKSKNSRGKSVNVTIGTIPDYTSMGTVLLSSVSLEDNTLSRGKYTLSATGTLNAETYTFSCEVANASTCIGTYKSILSQTTFANTTTNTTYTLNDANVRIEDSASPNTYSITATVYTNECKSYTLSGTYSYCAKGDATATMSDVNASFTSVSITPNTANSKATLEGTNINGDKIRLEVTGISSFDADIVVPAATYTIGTNAVAGNYNGTNLSGSYVQTATGTWLLASGSVTVSKSGNNISVSVSGKNFCDKDVAATITNVLPEIQEEYITITAGLVERFNSSWNDNYFRITGTATNGTYVRIETNKGWRTGDISNIIDESNNHQYTYVSSFNIKSGGHSVILTQDANDPFSFVVEATLYDTDNNPHNFVIYASYNPSIFYNGSRINMNDGSGYFDIVSGNFTFESKDGTSFKIGDYSKDECYSLNDGNNNFTPNNADIQAKVIKIDDFHYILYTWVWAKSKMYFYKTYFNNDYNSDRSYKYGLDNYITSESNAQQGAIILKLEDSEYAGYANNTYYYMYMNTWIKFVVNGDAYSGNYVPSKIYNVHQLGQTEESYYVVANDGNWNGNNPIHSGVRFYHSYYGYIRNSLLVDGTVEVINPNHDTKPMYLKVDGVNSYNNAISIYAASDRESPQRPPLYTISIGTNIQSENLDGSFTCAEGHGYTSSGIDSEETGNYYYAGTKLYLSATVNDPDNYRFKGWNINGNLYTDVAQTNYEYTVSETATIQAVFERIYAITITQPATGTLTVKNGNTTINSGDKIGEGTKLTVTYSGNGYDATISPVLDANNQFTVSSATTVSAVLTAHPYIINYEGLNGASNNSNNPSSYTIESADITLYAPGEREHYTFKEWQEGGSKIETIPTGSYGDKTLTAVWTTNKYTVTFNDEDGTELQKSDVEYNTQPSCTEPTKDATAQYTYTFAGWSDGENTYATADLPFVSGEATYTATYSSTVNKYTVTWQNYDNSALETDENVEYGTKPSYNGETPARTEDESFSYTFAGWDDDITAPVTGNITFTATYTSQAKAFVLKDGYTEEDKNNGNDDNFYSTLASIAEAGQPVESVTYERNFKPKTWSVFALPFDYALAQSGHAFEGNVYELIGTDYDYATDWMSLYFLPVTTKLYANRPYLYYSTNGVQNPIFQNVTIAALAPNYYSVTNTNAGGKVWFRNTLYRQALDKDPHVLFINGNKLYYMEDNNVYMRAFRGYFYLDGFDLNTGVAPRVRIVLNGQTATELEVVSDLPKSDDGQVKKYIENGVMVIEREGVRYDATGAKIN